MGENDSNISFRGISIKTGVALRKIQSSYELKIKPQTVSQPNVFPARKSSYIGHLRNQAFVNNMRLRFLKEDGSVPPKGLTRRSQSAPIFSSRTLKTLHQPPEEPPLGRATERKCKSANNYRGGLSKSTDITNTVYKDGRESRSSGFFVVRRSLSARKYYGQVNNESRNFGNHPESNGDFFKVRGHGINPPHVNDNPGSYLSLLRKDLSKRPESSEVKVGNSITTQHDFVARERLDYERQTDHLLQYYSKKVESSDRVVKNPERHRQLDERLCSAPHMNATPRNCTTPCSAAVANNLHQYNNKRSEYFINLRRHGDNGQRNSSTQTNSHFLLISRQAVLHNNNLRHLKSARDQRVYDTINGLSKKCECSMCQSDLNLNTSRLTLSPDEDSCHTSPSKRNREYWVNPSGPLAEEIIAHVRPFPPQELELNNGFSEKSTVE